MGTIRRQLPLLVRLWLLGQAMCLAAFVPLACCEHDTRAAEPPTCHREAAAKLCPMRAAGGTPCPMHRDSGSPSDSVALRGMCSPMDAALAAILLQPAIPLALYDFDPRMIAATTLRTIVSTPAFVPGSPDPRPPRI